MLADAEIPGGLADVVNCSTFFSSVYGSFITVMGDTIDACSITDNTTDALIDDCLFYIDLYDSKKTTYRENICELYQYLAEEGLTFLTVRRSQGCSDWSIRS